MSAKTIMIVDDEQDICFILKNGLEQAGFQVQAFTKPEEALEAYRADKYHLVISDVRMPQMSGFDLYRALRKNDPGVRIAFMTAFEVYYNEFRTMFPDVDVKLFIKKPIAVKELVALVRSQVNEIPE